jgi:hypothetical protein
VRIVELARLVGCLTLENDIVKKPPTSCTNGRGPTRRSRHPQSTQFPAPGLPLLPYACSGSYYQARSQDEAI